MNIETLKLAISEQREEIEREFREGNIITREAQNIAGIDKTRQVLTITGVRRCGKSTLAHLLLRGLKYGYVNFDDERLEGMEAGELNRIVEAFYQLYGDVNFMIFDEIQNIPKWELFATRLQRSKRIIVTGSNSRLLSGELATRLTGRHVDITLFPFSFREFMNFRDLKYDIYLTRDIAKLKNSLKDYLVRGGFPEGDDKEHVRSVYSDIITKDILLRHGIRFRSTFKEFARLAVSSFAREMTYSSMKNSLGIRSVHTARNYLEMLEEVFLVFRLPKFSFRPKEQIREPKKLYAVDNGIISVLGMDSGKSMGRIFENNVFMELKRRQSLHKNQELYYYKNAQGHEVDFVVREGSAVRELIQVCYSLEDEGTRNREIRSLMNASRELGCKSLVVVTEDYEAEEEVSWFGLKRKIRFIPLWKWFLTG